MPWDELRATFEPTTESVAEARMLVGPICEWLSADVATCLELVVSELATNAVRHAATPYEVAVRLLPTVRVEVSDRSPTQPVRRLHSLDEPRGWGLQILDQCAERWGVDARPTGKVVWADVGNFTRTDGPGADAQR
jgi:two-component sensor histidine kinase